MHYGNTGVGETFMVLKYSYEKMKCHILDVARHSVFDTSHVLSILSSFAVMLQGKKQALRLWRH